MAIINGIEYSDDEVFAILDDLVRKWFRRKYVSFTPPQKYAIVEAHRKNNILICSPTGSGKTLSAFLAAINELVMLAKRGALEDSVYILYVSPLKALNNDIKRNLEEPLAEIYQLAAEENMEIQPIRIGVRTGDTDQKERQNQTRKPPHILITTPESLAILLSTPKFSKNLENIRYLIIDEIHSLAENKRGSHITLSMERLEERQKGKMVRIGLSATIHPIEEVARFLVGLDNGDWRDCIVVDVSFSKSIDIKVVSPVEDLIYTPSDRMSELMYEKIIEMIQSARTTLIFTNTRSATERVVYNLRKRLGEEFVEEIGAHHSSLSKQIRLDIEERLKKGEMRCVVCSTSLELGIDIGYVDQVILLGSPKSISRALQRVGRSGHKLHEQSYGRILVLDQDDLVECTVLTKEAMDRNLDRVRIPEKPLDVLVQHILGMALEKVWNIDEALKVIKRAYPFRNLTKDEFISVLNYLSGSYSQLEKKKVYGKIWVDFDSNEFGKRGRMARPIYYLNVGVIPDEVAIRVVTKDGRRIGKIEEEFAERLVLGDIFVLGGKTYRFLRSRGMRIVVEEVIGERPTVPSWFSEQLPLSYDLGWKIQEFRRAVKERLFDEDITEWLISTYHLEDVTARAIVRYFREQSFISDVSTDRELIVEHFIDEKKLHNYVFHTVVGRRSNNALARVFGYRAGKKKGANVRMAIGDNGFMLTISKEMSQEELLQMFSVDNFQEDLIIALDRSEILKRRFRHVAVRSLLVLRNYLGREKSVWRQQMDSETLMRVIKKIDPNFPILKEVYREVMEDAMEIDNAIDYLNKVKKKEVKVTLKDLPTPSPFAFNLVAMGESDIVLMEDRKAFIQRLHARVMEVINNAQSG
jgi:ATP-dependent Lhr-like helicase